MRFRGFVRAIMVSLFAGLALTAIPALAPAWAQELAQETAGERFVHPRFGWSVAIPENWPYRPTEGSLIIRTPDGLPSGFFGIYTIFVRDKTLEEVVDSLEGQFKRNAEAKGTEFVVVSRKQIMLAESLPAIEIVKDVGSGKAGKSLRVMVMVDDNKGVVFGELSRLVNFGQRLGTLPRLGDIVPLGNFVVIAVE